MTQTSQKKIMIAIGIALLATIGVLLTIILRPTQEPLVDQEVVSDLSQEKSSAPLFFSTMTHMEGNWTQAASNLAFFEKQAAYLKTAMVYADEYDAVLTFESEIPFAEGMLRFDHNVFQEALDHGMGIGSHCDISPKIDFTDEEMIAEFQKRKDAVDALVDPLENLGCSGGGGLGDWYTGAVGAGFKYIDGTVGYHYLAMPLSQRPEGWTNKAILSEYYHYPAPWDEAQRYYPFRVSESSFTEDSDGKLVVSGGSVGLLEGMAEDQDCQEPCKLTQDDVDVLIEKIRAFAATRDTSRVAKMEVYIPTQTYDEPAMKYFFEQMRNLQEDGVLQWASQKEIYEAFVAWESGS